MTTAPANFGVGSWIERRARIAPDHLALIAGDQPVTYDELAARIRRLANGLRGLGVGHGDRVAWVGPNHPAFLETLFAVGQLGAILAPVNDRLDAEERGRVLADTEPLVLVEHSVEPTRAPAVRHRVHVGDVMHGSMNFDDLVAGSSDEPVEASVDMSDVFMLSHTSGTTGLPKGVMLTHANVTWNAVNFVTTADFRPDDVTIAIAPFFRVGGTGVNVLPILFLGGTVVVPDDASPDGILDALERHRVSVSFGNPDSLLALMRAPRWASADLSSLRVIYTGGAPVPEPLIRAHLDRGITLLQGYGLSEAAPLVLLLDAGHALTKVGSAGRPPLMVDVRIVDDAGADVATGVTGELLARGPNVMAGYWRLPEETADVLAPDGWLHTGDAARMDDEGFIAIVDRMSARLTVGGQAVFPGDIERELLEHPSVSDVGVVEGSTGLVAFVVAAPGAAVSADELLAFAGARLPAPAQPREIRFVDSLPRSSVGKLLRDNLRAIAEGATVA